MKKLFAALLLAVFGIANAAPIAMVLETPDLKLRLFATPCVAPAILKQIKPELREKFRAGNETDHGRDLELCWVIADEANVFIVDEDGDSGSVPMSAFKPADIL